jgi:hypothetical protein
MPLTRRPLPRRFAVLAALAVALGLLAACRQAPRRASPPPAAAAPGAGPAPTCTAAPAVHHLPPVSAAWILAGGAPAPGGTLDLKLRLTRHGRWPLPLRVRVSLPTGARLVGGDLRREVTLDPQAEADLDLRVQLDRVPADDLVAVVRSGAGHSGLHAEPRYRFGRPEPPPPAPPRSRRPLVIGGRSFGAPVAMPPR